MNDSERIDWIARYAVEFIVRGGEFYLKYVNLYRQCIVIRKDLRAEQGIEGGFRELVDLAAKEAGSAPISASTEIYTLE